jgi:hypothetical protein
VPPSYRVVWLKRGGRDVESEPGLTLAQAARWHATLWREFAQDLHWCHVVDERTGEPVPPSRLNGDEHLIEQVRLQQRDADVLARLRAAVREPAA